MGEDVVVNEAEQLATTGAVPAVTPDEVAEPVACVMAEPVGIGTGENPILIDDSDD